MANLNEVILIGNLTRDPELKYTPQGTAVCNFNLAINRKYGEGKEDTCFVKVIAWAKLGQVCAEYLSKGRPVMVEGRLQSRSWEAPDGSKRSVLEVVAENVQFLGQGKPKEEQQPLYPPEQPDSQEFGGGFEQTGPQDEIVPF